VDSSEAMSDPVESWLMKYIGIVATAAFSGMGAAMGWFRQHRIALLKEVASAKVLADERFNDLDCEISKLRDHNIRQDFALKDLETHREYSERKLKEIGETTKDTNDKMHELTRYLYENNNRHKP
jgi:hypothetical protein